MQVKGFQGAEDTRVSHPLIYRISEYSCKFFRVSERLCPATFIIFCHRLIFCRRNFRVFPPRYVLCPSLDVRHAFRVWRRAEKVKAIDFVSRIEARPDKRDQP